MEDTYFDTEDENEDLKDIILETELDQIERVCKKQFDVNQKSEGINDESEKDLRE
jgi:hypothetical protein